MNIIDRLNQQINDEKCTDQALKQMTLTEMNLLIEKILGDLKTLAALEDKVDFDLEWEKLDTILKKMYLESSLKVTNAASKAAERKLAGEVVSKCLKATSISSEM